MSSMFQSRMAGELERFLLFKRSLGHPYLGAETTLRHFDRHVAKHCAPTGPFHLDQLISSWLAKFRCAPVTINHSLTVVRQFCLHRRRSDPTGFVPGFEWAPQSNLSFRPHIFSAAEIRLLLRARRFPRGDPRSQTLRVLLLVLYCTGLRIGEAARLRIQDLDLRRRTFFIEHSKGKSRWVPFGSGLALELRKHINRRRGPMTPVSALFVLRDGTPLRSVTASRWLTSLFRLCGLKPRRGRVGPRTHDLRHTFAVHRLTRWYRQRVDLQTRLPLLSAYMGHDSIVGTQVYLNATPELLQLAASRFRVRFEGTGRS